jgi:Arc/MetJ family transcription regulator
VYRHHVWYTLERLLGGCGTMRTNIEIDDELMREALEASDLPTKRAAVEAGLRLLIRLRRQDAVRSLFGQVRWEGDLETSRLGRTSTG